MTETAESPSGTDFATFLASFPPETSAEISDLCYHDGYSGGQPSFSISSPDVELHCDVCNGVRSFRCDNAGIYPKAETWVFGYLHYSCRNCCKQGKVFAVAVKRSKANPQTGIASKLGETPAFGPPTPSRLISLIGPDRELFLKGRRAENRGLGIGAFSYYRRVVENQKSRIIKEIGKVAQRLGAKPEALEQFAAAAKETQFSSAIDRIKDGLPQVLLISGRNPLTLLHSALSEAIHEHTDEECLAIATDIRVVLTELAERISLALKDEAELSQAVSRLLNRKAAKS